jgi:TPR repeat protein
MGFGEYSPEPEAQYNLGVCYANGEGVLENYVGSSA